MAGKGWKFVLNMSRLVIQLLNCTTDLNKKKKKSLALVALALFINIFGWILPNTLYRVYYADICGHICTFVDILVNLRTFT